MAKEIDWDGVLQKDIHGAIKEAVNGMSLM